MPEPKDILVNVKGNDVSIQTTRNEHLESFLKQIRQVVKEEMHPVTTSQDKIEGLINQWLKQVPEDTSMDKEKECLTPVRRMCPEKSISIGETRVEETVLPSRLSNNMSDVPYASKPPKKSYEFPTMMSDGTPREDRLTRRSSRWNRPSSRLTSKVETHSSAKVLTKGESSTTLSARIKESEEENSNQKRKNRMTVIGAETLEDAKRKAESRVSEALALKKWMSSTAYQATLQNKELDKKGKCTWPGRTLFERVVCTSSFDTCAGILIVANSIVIGAEIEYKAANTKPSIIFQTLSITFAVVFTVETCIRLFSNHVQVYFFGPERSWNIFDLLMLAISLLEMADTGTKGGQKGFIRLVKMVRLLRIVRVMRFVPQLRIIVFMIFESVKSLIWLVVVLVTILYVFAVVFTMAATEYLMGSDGGFKQYRVQVADYYGTITRSVYSCFRAITSGQSWGEMMDPLVDISPFYVIIFLFFIAFSLFALFNIITGVFVDGAMEKSKNDRDLVVEKELAYKKACVENLKTLFQESDADNSGTISVRELEAHMSDPRFESYLSHLSIDTSDTQQLFALLDADGNGSIDMGEFVTNLMNLMRGQTTEQVVQKLMKENRTVLRHLDEFMDFVEVELENLRQCIEGRSTLTKPADSKPSETAMPEHPPGFA